VRAAALAAFDVMSVPELSPEVVLGRLGGENFPVALRWLPRALRSDLIAIYGAARLIDEAGDAARGDRGALLDAVEADVRAAFAGGRASSAAAPARAARCARDRRGAVRAPDRGQSLRPTRARSGELCRAARLLRAVGAAGRRARAARVRRAHGREPARLRRVCTALQVLEHCQDVAEDARAGRVYLPLDDRARFACSATDLVAAPASAGLRECIALQVARARELLARGAPLCGRLRGLARPVIAGYVAGGIATAAALARAGFDPNSASVRPRRRTTLRHALQLWALGSRA
jgi:phytoene/squalene synthetase